MKNMSINRYIVGGILMLLLTTGILPAAAQQRTTGAHSLSENIDFSVPVLNQYAEGSEVIIDGVTGVTTDEGCPILPVFSKTYEFPLGTQILSVAVEPSLIQSLSVEKPIRPVPTQQKIDDQLVPQEDVFDETVYRSMDPYPTSWYTVDLGAGLNSENDHTLFCNIHIYPTRYAPSSQMIFYSTHFDIAISYTDAPPAHPSSEQFSLVIITPTEFTDSLQPLVDHKISHGISTRMMTLEEIYGSYYGRDDAERIKYFIKYAVEEWDTQYVILVGDMKKLPIRFTYASWWEQDLLSDQYYADIFNANGEFCSWDANGNDRFGEINQDGYDLDGVDLYADVHVGRLACADVTEVVTVVNKIIVYEDETYNQIWFNRLVLAGGDTFPVSMGAPPFVYEGEITNIKVAQTMPDFQQTFLWTSKLNLHPSTFNRAINQGTGFVSYSGHGFEHGWGTSRPNAITKVKIYYYTPYINGLKNGNKLPIIFFDACLTAKLDFNITDLRHYYPWLTNALVRIFSLSSDPHEFYQCFAWSFLAKENGGAIATIGSSRTAYTRVDANGVYGGAGYLNVHFFDAYTQGIAVGQMLTSSQNAYIQNVGADYFTIEEFMLLGDPSLLPGGYQ
jgi:hypothetical protein